MKNKLIKKVTSDHNLIKLSKLIGVKIDNIYDITEITQPLTKKGSYLILLRRDNSVGHWVCVCDGYYFDSAGVGPPTVLGDLPHFDKQIQAVDRGYCGIYAMLFLYAKQKNKMCLFDDFKDLDIDVI